MMQFSTIFFLILGTIFTLANCNGQKLKQKYSNNFHTLKLKSDSTYLFEFTELKYNKPNEKIVNSGKWKINQDFLILTSTKFHWSPIPSYVEIINPMTEKSDSILISIYDVVGKDTTINNFDVTSIEVDNNEFIIPFNGFPYKTKLKTTPSYFILWYSTGKCEKKYFIKNSKSKEYKIYLNSYIDLNDKPFRFEFFELEKLKIHNKKLILMNNIELN